MKFNNKFLLVLGLAFCSCTAHEKKTATFAPLILPNVSTETEIIFKKAFPGVMAVHEFADSVIHHLHTKFNIPANKMLLGVSTCVDDIIFTKNFHLHPEIKGPFHLGGLGGLPFTGISGLEAFAHHIPDSGSMILLIEPHIGYSQKRGWGRVLRYEQHEATTCCGALIGTLGKLQQDKLSGIITEDDYQGGKLGELALRHKKEILAARDPIIELTKLTLQSAEKQIRAHVLDMEIAHVKCIVIITGVIINTDFSFSDYQYIDRIMVYYVNKQTFVEDLRNPLVQP